MCCLKLIAFMAYDKVSKYIIFYHQAFSSLIIILVSHHVKKKVQVNLARIGMKFSQYDDATAAL